MAWKYIQYEYPVPFIFEKFLMWSSVNFDCYFALKEHNSDNWTYFAGNGAHALESGRKLTDYSTSESNAQTNYLTTVKDSDDKSIAVMPNLFFAKYVRIYIDDTPNVQLYEFRPSTIVIADEVLTGTLDISDQFSAPPLIRVSTGAIGAEVERVKIGRYDGTHYGMIGYDGSNNALFELGDNQNIIAGWEIDQTQIKKLSGSAGVVIDSSVPSITLTDGTYDRVYIGKTGAEYEIVLRDESGNVILQNADGTNKSLAGWNIDYEKIQKNDVLLHSSGKIQIGSGLANDTAFNVHDKLYWDGTALHVEGELIATTGTIGGWNLSATEIYSDGSTVVLDSDNKAIYINDSTFGNAGLQLQYNSGTPRIYIGDGANQYFEFDGTNISWKGTNAELTSAGQLSVSNLSATGGSVAGWTIDSSKIYKANAYLHSDGYVSFGSTPPPSYGNNAGAWFGYDSTKAKMSLYVDADNYLQFDGEKVLIKAANFELNSSGNVTAAGGSIGGWNLSATEIYSDGSSIILDSSVPSITIGSIASDGLQLDSSGLALYDGGTQKGAWLVDSEFWLGPSSANRKIEFDPDTDTFFVRGNAAFDTLVFQEKVATRGSVLVTKSAGELFEATTATGSTFDVKVTSPPSGGAPFVNGDRCLIDNGINSTWFTVGDGTDYTTYFKYVATYQSGSNSATYKEGTGIADYGGSGGDVWIELSADDSNAPWMRMSEHDGTPWSSTTVNLAVGNLNGTYGYSSDVYGFAAGVYSGTEANITIDTTNGMRIRSGSTDKMVFGADGTAYVADTLFVGPDKNIEFDGSNGRIMIYSGGDIFIQGDDSNPGLIRFYRESSNTTYNMGIDNTYGNLSLYTSTDGTGNFYVGLDLLSPSQFMRFKNVKMYATEEFGGYISENAGNYGRIRIERADIGGPSPGNMNIIMEAYDSTSYYASVGVSAGEQFDYDGMAYMTATNYILLNADDHLLISTGGSEVPSESDAVKIDSSGKFWLYRGPIEIDIDSGDSYIIFDTDGSNRFSIGVDGTSKLFKISSGGSLIDNGFLLSIDNSSEKITVPGKLILGTGSVVEPYVLYKSTINEFISGLYGENIFAICDGSDTSSNQRFSINEKGKVGINTVAQSSQFQVTQSGTDGTHGLSVEYGGALIDIFRNSSSQFEVRTSGLALPMNFHVGAGNDKQLYLDGSGWVGVGKDPDYKFDISLPTLDFGIFDCDGSGIGTQFGNSTATIDGRLICKFGGTTYRIPATTDSLY